MKGTAYDTASPCLFITGMHWPKVLQYGAAAMTLRRCNCGNVDPRRLGTLTAQRFMTSSHGRSKGAGMGDKGGKKDKEKNKQQQVTKHKQEEQTKRDKAPVSRTPQ
jgi:hypothetical protein